MILQELIINWKVLSILKNIALRNALKWVVSGN